jgi:hypothetical protein
MADAQRSERRHGPKLEVPRFFCIIPVYRLALMKHANSRPTQNR